jgi:CBS domain-containing protein
MKVREVMSRDVQVARPDDSLRSVAQTMAQADIGALPVCDGQRLQGMVTDRDIAIRGVAQGLNADTPVRQVMTGNLEFLYAEDDLDRAADKMASSQIRRLPVVDESQQLVGIISLGDLSREHKEKVVGRTLEDISEPTRGGLSSDQTSGGIGLSGRTTGDLSGR